MVGIAVDLMPIHNTAQNAYAWMKIMLNLKILMCSLVTVFAMMKPTILAACLMALIVVYLMTTLKIVMVSTPARTNTISQRELFSSLWLESHRKIHFQAFLMRFYDILDGGCLTIVNRREGVFWAVRAWDLTQREIGHVMMNSPGEITRYAN